MSSLVRDAAFILVDDTIDKVSSPSVSSRVTGVIENIDSTLASSLETNTLVNLVLLLIVR